MFPDQLDNTIISSAKRCLTQARLAYIENLSPVGESVHLHFGGALAAGLEAARVAFYQDGRSPQEAVALGMQIALDTYGDFEPPFKSPKTREAAADAVWYYFHVWPLEADVLTPTRNGQGQLRVEWQFRHPLPGLVHPDHGGPIYYVGRSDMIPLLLGMPVVEDDKSASQLGEKWGQQWRLDSQFIGYIWAMQQDGIIPPNQPGTAVIRGLGIYTRKYVKRGTNTLARKVTQDMIDVGEVVYDPLQSFGHDQAIVHHTPSMIAKWLRETQRVVGRMVYAYLNDPDGTRGEWDMALDKAACGGYGGCPFNELCLSDHPEQWKDVNFVRRVWNPLGAV